MDANTPIELLKKHLQHSTNIQYLYGLVDMAFFAGVIDLEQSATYYTQIAEKEAKQPE